MQYELIVSQGRIADRTPGAIRGAMLTARKIGSLTGLASQVIGSATMVHQDQWQTALPEAEATLWGISLKIEAALIQRKAPLLIANTCSASLAALPLVAHHRPKARILWIDAHGDFNTPATTTSGYLGGMVLAAACGLWDSGHGSGLDPKRVILVGARDIDPDEDELLKKSGVLRLDADAARIAAEIGDDPVWIHIDWDVLEPGHVPAAYAIPEGPTPAQLRGILAALPHSQIAGVELAEFEASGNPGADNAAIEIIADIVAPLFAEASDHALPAVQAP